MSSKRIAGQIFFKVNGTQYAAKGSFTYRVNPVKRTAVVGADAVHGYSEVPQESFIDGMISDAGDLDLAALQALDGVTVTLELANGKTIILHDAWYASDGDVTTEHGEIQCRFEGPSGEEMKA